MPAPTLDADKVDLSRNSLLVESLSLLRWIEGVSAPVLSSVTRECAEYTQARLNVQNVRCGDSTTLVLALYISNRAGGVGGERLYYFLHR